LGVAYRGLVSVGGDMNQETYPGDGRIGRRRRQKLAITLVRLSAFLLASSCAVAQTGKLSDEARSKIETAVSRFMEGSKRLASLLLLYRMWNSCVQGDSAWPISKTPFLQHHKRCTASPPPIRGLLSVHPRL
jgi:hypothetical protein